MIKFAGAERVEKSQGRDGQGKETAYAVLETSN